MSHTTTIKGVKISDIAALRSAVLDLQNSGVKCELKENHKPRMYYENQHGKCPYTLVLPGQYDVGFELQTDGSYAPVFDEFYHDVARNIGADVNVCPIPKDQAGRATHQIGKLMQGYAKHAAINAAVKQGYIVEDTSMDAQGNVHLTLGGMY